MNVIPEKVTQVIVVIIFKIVFTFDVFLSTETTMHCKVTCILYKKQAYFSQLLFTSTISDPMTVTCQEEPVSERQTTVQLYIALLDFFPATL